MRHGIWKIPACVLGAVGLATAASGQSAPKLEVGDAFRVMHLYGGSDGESHLDTISLPNVDSRPGEFVQSRLFSTDVELGEAKPGMFVDWHGVSSPRFLIILAGQLEIGLGDGSKHILRAGDMVLAADTTGRGHTSRTIGTEVVRSLTVRLPKDDPLALKLNPCPPGVPDSQCVAARQRDAAKAKTDVPPAK